jgi:organic radical activating enzyme
VIDTVKGIECINTFQGEGPDVGKRMLLFRFKYCNKVCPWCDTVVKMRVQQEAEYKIRDLQEIVSREKVGLLITGGEPTLDRHFEETVALLKYLKYSVANVETNGYDLIDLIDKVGQLENIHYIYSPKIFKVSDLEAEIERTEKLKKYENVYIKLVYEDREFIDLYIGFLQELNINNRIYLMPEGTIRDDLIKNSPRVFDMAEKYKFNFSTRSHIIYGFV